MTRFRPIQQQEILQQRFNNTDYPCKFKKKCVYYKKLQVHRIDYK